MATRQKKTVISGVTREAADVAFATFAKADASINKINADIELQCAKIREKHQAELTRLTAERDSSFEMLQAPDRAVLEEKEPRHGARHYWLPHRNPEAEDLERLHLGLRFGIG